MVETIHSLQQVALHTRLAHATITLAQYEAEKAVKLALKGQGLKPQYIARREIVTMAKDYLAAHPELLAQAKPIVEQWRREEFFGKRAARVERNSQHLHKSRSAEPQGLSLCETLERNGAAK